MQNRFGLLSGIAAVGLVMSLTGAPTQAGQQRTSALTNPEDTLLGIQLLHSNFRDVLRKYGQPSEIQAGGPYAPTPPPGIKKDTGGGMGGPGMGGPGMPGMPGSGGAMGKPGMGGPGMPGAPGGGGGSGNKKTTSHNGFPGKNGSGGGAGGPGAPGSGGSAGPRMPGMPGSPGGPGGPGSGGGLPGFGAGGPGMAPPSSAGGSSEGEGGGLGTGQQSEEDQPMHETTWWYHRPQTGEHFAFVFNRKGEVIQVGEYSPHPLSKINGKTRQGVDLGSSMGLVLNKYGFSLDGAHDGDNVIMRFGGSHKIAFQMVKGKVLGITIGVVASRGGASMAMGSP